MERLALEQIAVAFVNYHSEALITPRAAALTDAGLAVFVADNSATYSGTGVRVPLPGNVGFGTACNRVVDALPGTIRAVCLHNPDVDATPDGIRRLSDALARQARPGAVAPAVKVGGVLRDQGFAYPHALRELVIAWRGARPDTRSTERHPPRVWRRGRRFASAALLLVSLDAYRAIGGFDERYFLYGEDADLWHRLRRHGFNTEFCPSVVVGHEAATGSRMSAGNRELLRWVGIELFLESHGTGWRLARLAHRSLLGAMRGRAPELAALLAREWRQGHPPTTVAAAVRDRLRDGVT
jgi:N-acetylglucosaminyl-diphospho-decaprenol L-rhamnosyltransferase